MRLLTVLFLGLLACGKKTEDKPRTETQAVSSGPAITATFTGEFKPRLSLSAGVFKVTNGSDKDTHWLEFQVYAYDGSGKQIGAAPWDAGGVLELKPGATVDHSMGGYLDSQKAGLALEA